MFQFAHPQFLYLLLLIPALAFVQLFFAARRKKAVERFGNPELMEHLMPDVSAARPAVKFYLLLLALAVVIFMMASPQFGTKLQTIQRKGIELMIALDVSNSMNAADIEPSRLEMAKQAVARLTDRLRNDRIGMVVFAGQAYVQIPITSDYASAKMFLSAVNTGVVPVQGTAIGAAINMSVASFSNQEDINRAIIVITDGENHEDDAIGAAKTAVEKGIQVYTVGMGSSQGAPIPVGGQGNFLRDRDGNVVVTKLNEEMLRQIADAGNGEYIAAGNIRAGINQLVDTLSELEKSELESKIYTDFEDRFQYLAVLALIILIVELLILERKNKLLRKIDLFAVNKIEREKEKAEITK
jgi:Ca-activated chloride channel family protein